MDDDKKVGLYEKFYVRRNDQSPKHRDCEYFVLDLNHDKHAARALYGYVKSCFREYPALARDLTIKMEELERKIANGEI